MNAKKFGVVVSLTYALIFAFGIPRRVRGQTSKTNYPKMAPVEQYLTDEGRQITIQVLDYAGIESGILPRAEHVAEDVLRDSGLDTVWVVCLAGGTWSKDVACTTAPSPMQLTLIMLPRSMSKRAKPRSDKFGFALADGEDGFGCRASVFYDRVKDSAEQRGSSLPEFLGNVVAHELGHLLLGANSHSGMGLMSARWSSRELGAAEHGGLFFSSSEGERIRKAVAARWRAACKTVSCSVTDYIQHGILGSNLPRPW